MALSAGSDGSGESVPKMQIPTMQRPNYPIDEIQQAVEVRPDMEEPMMQMPDNPIDEVTFAAEVRPDMQQPTWQLPDYSGDDTQHTAEVQPDMQWPAMQKPDYSIGQVGIAAQVESDIQQPSVQRPDLPVQASMQAKPTVKGFLPTKPDEPHLHGGHNIDLEHQVDLQVSPKRPVLDTQVEIPTQAQTPEIKDNDATMELPVVVAAAAADVESQPVM